MDETRRLIGLVLAGGLLLFALSAAVGIYLVRGGAQEAITITSRPLIAPDWQTSAPASNETAAGNRVTVRSSGESEPGSWNFPSRSETSYSFDDLWGSRSSETRSDWRASDAPRRWGARERWRPRGIEDNDTQSDRRSGGWERREETVEERIEAARLDLTTPEGKLERACLLEDYSRYACRCVVREAVRLLSAGEIDFLTRAEQNEPPATRLRAAGLGLDSLPDLAVDLVSLDAATRRYCGAGFTL